MAATAAGRARARVGRDAQDKGEQGDRTAMGSDVGIGFLGDRAENDFEKSELNDENYF